VIVKPASPGASASFTGLPLPEIDTVGSFTVSLPASLACPP
jgi:hypothetical protein